MNPNAEIPKGDNDKVEKCSLDRNTKNRGNAF